MNENKEYKVLTARVRDQVSQSQQTNNRESGQTAVRLTSALYFL